MFAFFQAHLFLVWVLFLAPLGLVMWRGYILDQRAERYGMKSRYGAMMVLGFMPLINIPIALLCTLRTWAEWHRNNASYTTTW